MSRIVMSGYEGAKKLLSDHLDLLNRVAAELLEKEVINGQELDDLIGIGQKRNVESLVPETGAVA